jgi:hypothetical protein
MILKLGLINLKRNNMTAVEFFNEQLGNILELYPSEWEKINKVYEESKEMEKQQHEQTFEAGYGVLYTSFEQYYLETLEIYKNNKP